MSTRPADNPNPRRQAAADELQVPTTAARMLSGEMQMLFALMYRQHGLLVSARAELPPGTFSPIMEAGPWLFLTALYGYYDRYSSVPPTRVFELECERISSEKAAMGQPVGGLEWATETALLSGTPVIDQIIATTPQYGTDLLSRLLIERTVSDALASMTRQTPGHLVYVNIHGVIEELTSRNTRAEAVRSNALSSIVPTAEELAAYEMPRTIPTGVNFIDDDVLDGYGCEAGKVYGLLGPYGSFKTGLGVQIITSASVRQTAEADPGLCVYFVYEGGKMEIQMRGIAQLAQMPKDTVRDYFRSRGDASLLSTSGALKDYEVERYDRLHTATNLRLGEAERYAKVDELRRYLHVADMSGSKGNETAGSGYVPEIVQYLDRLTREHNLPIRMVVIDYVKKMSMRHLEAKGYGFDRLREMVSPVPDRVRRMVAEKFGCAVWLIQQLNAEANKKAPGAAQHHADAAESKDFGESLWYCLTLSNPDRSQDNTLQLAVTKSRDSAAPPSGIVVRIDRDSFTLVRDRDHVIGSNGRIAQSGFHGMIRRADGTPEPTLPAPTRENPNVYDE